MKQLKVIGILAGIVALSGVGYYFIDQQLTEQEKLERADSTPVSLFSFDSEQVKTIHISNPEGDFNFSYDNGSWDITNQDFTINIYSISAICSYFSDLSSVQTITENPKDLAAFGFDQPITLTCTMTDGKTHTLLVGSPTPVNDAYYAKLPDSDTIYTIDYISGSFFSASRNSLKNTYLFDVYASEITRFSLERGDKVIYDLRYDHTNGWNMAAPLEFEGYTAQINNMLDSFTRINVIAFLEEKPDDLSRYGLDNPYCKLIAETADQSTTILVGDMISPEDDETIAYGMFEESKQIFMFTRADIAFIDDETVDKIYPYIYSAEINEVAKLDVDCNEVQATLDLDYDNMIYKIDGVTIDPEDKDGVTAYQNFYRGVATLAISDVKPDAVPEGEAEIAITYTYENGEEVKHELIPETDTTYWVMQNGSYTGLITRKKYITRSSSIVPTYALLQEYLDTLK